MRNIIVGTAGHIDHGKTALVRALTGIDTDRLEEEKRRGISIDLGFAHLERAGVGFGFVDVPGHERFVRNMLAGAGGIDMVVLVIGADESIKPQTREHFDICRLLGIGHGLIALTKSDLVDADTLELARLEASEFVSGSFLENAPIIAVSSKTGAGLNEFLTALLAVARAVPPRPARAGFRLPIDRAFTMKGFGTVVTGTLWSGQLAAEDEVEIYPLGRRLRVRALQVHGGSVAVAEAGQRTAVNLAGIDTSDLRRGMTLAPPGWYEPTQAVDCRLELLNSTARLRHRALIHFHSGTAETVAEVRLLERRDAIEPGASAFVRLLLREPLLLLPGDRFIARLFSPMVTIGGGAILDNQAPLRLRKGAALDRLPRLARATLPERVKLLLEEAPGGVGLARLAARCGAAPQEVVQAAKETGCVDLGDAERRLVAESSLEHWRDTLRATLENHHREHRLQPGMSKAATGLEPILVDALLARWPEFAAEGELLRLASFRPTLKGEEDAALGKMEALFRDAGLAVPAVAEVLKASGVDANRSRTLLQTLLRDRKLVRVGPDLIFHASALEQLRALLAARKGRRFGVGEFKDWTGVSRKYAIPLLEYLDRERVTRREGDQRVVL